MSRISSFPRSPAVLAAVIMVLASAAPVLAADRNGGSTIALSDAQATIEAEQKREVASVGPFRGNELTRRLQTEKPWPAPVGHHQPRASDVVANAQPSSSEAEEQRLDRELKGKLIICRGC